MRAQADKAQSAETKKSLLTVAETYEEMAKQAGARKRDS